MYLQHDYDYVATVSTVSALFVNTLSVYHSISADVV